MNSIPKDVDEDFQELLEYTGKADYKDIEELCSVLFPRRRKSC